MEDDRSRERRERGCRLVVGLAVVDDDGQLRARPRARDARRRAGAAAPASRSRGPCRGPSPLPRPPSDVRSSSRSSSSRAASGSAAWCGWMPSAAYTPSWCSADLERGATRVDAGADGDDPRDARGSRARSTSVVDGLVARIEVRVRVSHSVVRLPFGRAPRRRPRSASSFAKSGAGSRSDCPAGARWPPSGPPTTP